MTRVIRLAIANMAGVPSIVYGLFGVALFVIQIDLGRSIMAGALTLACLTLPVIITATEEALQQIPTDLRHASLALGATKLRTIRKVVLPAAAPASSRARFSRSRVLPVRRRRSSSRRSRSSRRIAIQSVR